MVFLPPSFSPLFPMHDATRPAGRKQEASRSVSPMPDRPSGRTRAPATAGEAVLIQKGCHFGPTPPRPIRGGPGPWAAPRSAAGPLSRRCAPWDNHQAQSDALQTLTDFSAAVVAADLARSPGPGPLELVVAGVGPGNWPTLINSFATVAGALWVPATGPIWHRRNRTGKLFAFSPCLGLDGISRNTHGIPAFRDRSGGQAQQFYGVFCGAHPGALNGWGGTDAHVIRKPRKSSRAF